MQAEMRFIVKENIIRGMYDNGNLMIYAADGVKEIIAWYKKEGWL